MPNCSPAAGAAARRDVERMSEEGACSDGDVLTPPTRRLLEISRG